MQSWDSFSGVESFVLEIQFWESQALWQQQIAAGWAEVFAPLEAQSFASPAIPLPCMLDGTQSSLTCPEAGKFSG